MVFMYLLTLFIVINNRYTLKMKKHIKILMFPLLILLFFGCNKKNSEAQGGSDNFGKDASYAFGMSVGIDMKDYLASYGVSMDTDQFIKGLTDSISGEKTLFTPNEANQLVEAAFTSLMQVKDTEYIQKETAFLAENSKKPGIIITSSGLQYEVIRDANGPKPSYDDTVVVHYTGKLVDGKIFDSSYDRNAPESFQLYHVISGWAEGLQLMSVGSKYIFYIPSEHGYGPSGIQSVIPPYSTLIFEVELLDIIKQEEI
jgi:FKBP-type peptidyl-prolyl cis-trans isomerase